MKLKIIADCTDKHHYTSTASFVHRLNILLVSGVKNTHFVLPAVALPQLICAVQTPETLLGNYSTVIFTPQT